MKAPKWQATRKKKGTIRSCFFFCFLLVAENVVYKSSRASYVVFVFSFFGCVFLGSMIPFNGIAEHLFWFSLLSLSSQPSCWHSFIVFEFGNICESLSLFIPFFFTSNQSHFWPYVNFKKVLFCVALLLFSVGRTRPFCWCWIKNQYNITYVNHLNTHMIQHPF